MWGIVGYVLNFSKPKPISLIQKNPSPCLTLYFSREKSSGRQIPCYLLYHIAISLADCSLAICDVKGKKSHKSTHFFFLLTHLPIPFQFRFSLQRRLKSQNLFETLPLQLGIFYGKHILNQASIFRKFSSFSLYVFRIFNIRVAPKIKENHLSLLFLFSLLSNCSWASNDEFEALLVSTHQQAAVVSWRATA